MGSYKDMINMIGNVKHIPSIIESAILNSTKKMNIGGTYNSNDPYDPFTPGDGGPGTGTGTGTSAGPGAGGFSGFTDVSIDNPEIYTGTGDPFGRPPVEPQPRGGGGSNVTGAGVGTSVSRMSSNIDKKATKGGGSLSLTPYNIDTTIDSPFVNKSVAMYDDGGMTTDKEPDGDTYGYYSNYVKSVEASDAVMKKTDSIIPKPGGGFYKAFENGRYYPYKDVGGKVTIGFGRTNSAVKGLDIENDYRNGITVQEANNFLQQDIGSNMKSLREDFDGEFGEGEFNKLSEIEQYMLVDFEYNLGNAVKKFPKFMNAIRTGDYEQAEKEYKRHSYKNKGEPNEIKRELGRNKVFYNSYLGEWINRHGGESKGYIPGVVSLPTNQNTNTMVSLPMNPETNALVMNQDVNTMPMSFKKGGKFKNGGKKKL